jgi:Fe-S oxidoreductase
MIVGLRRGVVNTGAWEDNHGAKLFLALERGSNALGISATERDKFIEKSALPLFDGTQEYCLWLGCMGAYDPRGREILLALVKIMAHLKVSFGVLRKEKCTGDPVRRLGNDLLFQQLAESNLEALKQNRVKKIVSICPHCVRTIQEDWKTYGTPPEVEHHSEFLARYAHLLPSVKGDNDLDQEKIVFHDPCYLGRYRDVYDEPRQVAAMAGELVEAPRARERSFCCGAGGGLVFLGEEKGERVSHARAEELAATGANVVGTACPFCNTMFRDAFAEKGDNAPELMDIAQLVAQGLAQADSTTKTS